MPGFSVAFKFLFLNFVQSRGTSRSFESPVLNKHGIEYKIQQTHKIQTATPQQAASNSFD